MSLAKKNLKIRRIRFLLIALSISFMVSSALISYHLIQKNDAEIAVLQKSINAKQNTINQLWQSAIARDQKIDNAIIITLLAKNSKKDYSKLVEKYFCPKDTSIENLSKIIIKSKAEKKQTIKLINDIYTKKLSLQDQVTQKQNENRLNTALALFLQLLGVVIISLIRDVK